MNNIINLADIRALKDMSSQAKLDKVNPIIAQAQITELKDTLGSAFYFDLLSNLENSEYQDLLSGCTFTHEGIDYYQDGIKALLADYFMAKYILLVQVNMTPFGAIVKETEFSQPVERNLLKDLSTQQMQLAGSRWEIIKMYLDANTSTFPNWATNNSCEGKSPSERSFRFRKL